MYITKERTDINQKLHNYYFTLHEFYTIKKTDKHWLAKQKQKV